MWLLQSSYKPIQWSHSACMKTLNWLHVLTFALRNMCDSLKCSTRLGGCIAKAISEKNKKHPWYECI